jgi:hypothetical protein
MNCGKSVAAEMTDQHALQERGALGPTRGEPAVLLEALLRQRELSGRDQRRYRNLDPLFPRARRHAQIDDGDGFLPGLPLLHVLQNRRPTSVLGEGGACDRRAPQWWHYGTPQDFGDGVCFPDSETRTG